MVTRPQQLKTLTITAIIATLELFSSLALGRGLSEAGELPKATPGYQVLLDFDGTNIGSDPKGSLTLVKSGRKTFLFGRTSAGGANNGGTIFGVLIPSDSLRSPAVIALDKTDGRFPHHDSMLCVTRTAGSTVCSESRSGKATIWGTTLEGGATDLGAIFAFDPLDLMQKGTPPNFAYAFAGPKDGGLNADAAKPHSVFSSSSRSRLLYGATAEGGANGGGTLYTFPLSPAATADKVLFNFNASGTADVFNAGANCPATVPAPLTGDTPHGRPIIITTGGQDVLLGMTRQGGIGNGSDTAIGNGVLFAYAPKSATYTALHYFQGQPCAVAGGSDGAYSDHGNLTLTSFKPGAHSAVVYGLTTAGGSGTFTDSGQPLPGSGVLFMAEVKLGSAPAIKSYQVVHEFGLDCTASPTNCVTDAQGNPVQDGYNPYGSLVRAKDGWLYGMTRNGGANWQKLYGGTASPPAGGGTIFRFKPDKCSKAHCYQVVWSFDLGSTSCDPGNPTPTTCDTTGSTPIDNLIVSGKTLYGMTQRGGANDLSDANEYGTMFSFVPPVP